MRQRTHCHCGNSLADVGQRYIYPVPAGLIEDQEFAPNEGIYVCLACAPAAVALQVEQGIVIPRMKEKRDGGAAAGVAHRT